MSEEWDKDRERWKEKWREPGSWRDVEKELGKQIATRKRGTGREEVE